MKADTKPSSQGLNTENGLSAALFKGNERDIVFFNKTNLMNVCVNLLSQPSCKMIIDQLTTTTTITLLKIFSPCCPSS